VTGAVALVVMAGCTRGDGPPGRHSATADGVDGDGDGFTVGADCDDGDPDRHLGAPDPAGDGVDGDCDGADGSGRPLAEVAVVALPVGEDAARVTLRFGEVLAIGDLQAGGTAEVVVGTYEQSIDFYEGVEGDGGVWGLAGLDLAVVASVRGEFSEGSGELGSLVWVGDLAGGSQADLVTVSNSNVLLAVDGVPTDLDDFARSKPRGSAFCLEGGDLNGDHRPDLVWDTSDGTETSLVLWFDPVLGPTDVADHVIAAPEIYENVGDCSLAIGDWSGDGQPDLVVALPNREDLTGRVLGVRGPFTEGSSALADAEWIVDGAGPGDWLGEELGPVADLDGDGAAELLVAALGWPGEDVFGGTRHGKVVGLPAGGVPGDAPYVVESDGGVAELLGRSMAVGDLNDDGVPDLAVGAPGNSYRGDDWLPGRALVFFGPLRGTLRASEADVVFVGDQPGGAAGWSLAVGDTTGDAGDRQRRRVPRRGAAPLTGSTAGTGPGRRWRSR
jgi:hypothetical protein